MNQQVRDVREVALDLPREVDGEVAGFDQKEADFDSPDIDCWALAAFTQHGLDEARWPESVREIIFE